VRWRKLVNKYYHHCCNDLNKNWLIIWVILGLRSLNAAFPCWSCLSYFLNIHLLIKSSCLNKKNTTTLIEINKNGGQDIRNPLEHFYDRLNITNLIYLLYCTKKCITFITYEVQEISGFDIENFMLSFNHKGFARYR
jgi:hypothetical protein